MLAALQDTNPGHEGPAIDDGYLITHGRHIADALRNNFKDLSVGKIASVIGGKIDRTGEPSLRVYALTATGAIMADAAINMALKGLFR